MLTAVLLLLSAPAAVVSAAPAAAVSTAPAAAVSAAPAPDLSPPPQVVLEANWLAASWRRVLSAPDAQAAHAALEAIEAGGLARGIRSLPLPALALLRAEEGTVRLSLEERVVWARRLAYDSAAVHFAAAKSAWSIGFFEVISGYGAALSTLGRDFGYFAGVVSRIAVVFVLALILSCLAFTLAMAVKRGPGLIHDLDHFLPIGLPGPFGIALGIALAGLPLLLGLGWIGTAMVWLLALWGTLANRERVVAALFLVLIGASQPIAGAVAALLPSPDSQRSVAAVLRVQSGVALPADRVLLAADARETGDPIAFFSLGRSAWVVGDKAEAISAMRSALAGRPRWVAAMNNLAIFLLQHGESAEAEHLFKRALALEPRNARVLFNLSYLYRRDFRLKEAEKAYIEARNSDVKAVDHFTEVTGSQGSFVVPATLNYGDLWRKRLKAEPGSALLVQNLARGFLGRIPLRWAGATVLLGFMLASLGSHLMEKKGRAGRCGHCGSDTCPVCHGNEIQNGLCRPCHVIYVQAQTVEARVKLAQDQRVMRYRAERRRKLLIAGTVVPGLGHLLMEQIWLGTALLFLASLTAFAPLYLIVSGVLPGLWTPPLAPVLGGIMLLLVAGGALAAFVLGGRNLFAKLRPI